MHGETETSNIPRVICTLCHAAFLVVAFWIYFGTASEILPGWLLQRSAETGSSGRLTILFLFGVVLFLRMTFGLFYLLKRRFGWDELAGVLLALLVYQVGFALFGQPATFEISLLDIGAIFLFLLGSFLNTASEWQRKRFKDRPENRGRLYTGGLFRRVRHINYFGDMLWVSGWAIVTRNAWAALIPVALTLAFVLLFVPSLSRHLRARYGRQFEEWEARTDALIPWVY